MKKEQVTPAALQKSVLAVPPLARHANGSFNRSANQKIIQHLEAGGVTTLLYGGNAILYHAAASEYAELLTLLTELAGQESLVIPSVGPAYGTMMDQAAILQDFDFPTAMILPTRDAVTSAGVSRGVQRFVEATGRPAILYIKFEGYVEVDTIKGMMDDGLLSCIKYAIVRDRTADDDYLKSLIDVVDPARIVSGIGEQPAITHLKDFGLTCFTSGCVCVAPQLSMAMLHAIQRGDFETAESIRATFAPLEALRNAINPIRVLHTALALAGIAETGPMIPLLSEIDPDDRPAIAAAAQALLAANQ